MFHIVEDDDPVREILKLVFQMRGVAVEAHSHWAACKPNPGDIVLTDMINVGSVQALIGVRVFTMSGYPDVQCDMPKPFEIKDIEKFITTHLMPPTLKRA